MLKGAPASAGIGIGRAVLLQNDNIVVTRRTVTDVAAENRRLHDAIKQFCLQVEEAADIVRRNTGDEEASIISSQCELVRDPELQEEITRFIEERTANAEYAFETVCEKYIALFDALDEDTMRSKAADLRDIKTRMLAILMNVSMDALQYLPKNSVLIADDVSPSQAVVLDPERICAIVTRQGTRYSHIAIIARALRIPAVVAVDDICRHVRDGDELIVDGEQGSVIHKPTQERLRAYRERQQKRRRALEQLNLFRSKETRTADGRRVRLAANLSLLSELQALAEFEVDGIGLLRTEFLYMNAGELPDEEHQFQAYRRVALAMGGKPVVVRTLDIGGDKSIPGLDQPPEDNPAMGMRAVRFCMANPAIFKVQLRALLRAGVYGNLRIMIPLISTANELRAVKVLIAQCIRELQAEGATFNANMEVGIMIETPAAAMCADILARESDFFSIGTNDLTQFMLAADRGNEDVAGIYSSMHPSVLRMIDHTVRCAHKAGIPVNVCGEMASDMRMVPILVGLGVDGLSVPPGFVLEVRRRIYGTTYECRCDQIDHILNLATADEVQRFLKTARTG